MAKYFSCGFMRVKHYTGISERFENFVEQFDHVLVEEKHFQRKSPELNKFSRKHHQRGEKKKDNAKFSIKNWNLLSKEKRVKHTIGECQECSTYADLDVRQN